jgi:hypothetical protein
VQLNRRKSPLKKYVLTLSPLSALIGLIIPGKDWASILGALKQLFASGQGTQARED